MWGCGVVWGVLMCWRWVWCGVVWVMWCCVWVGWCDVMVWWSGDVCECWVGCCGGCVWGVVECCCGWGCVVCEEWDVGVEILWGMMNVNGIWMCDGVGVGEGKEGGWGVMWGVGVGVDWGVGDDGVGDGMWVNEDVWEEVWGGEWWGGDVVSECLIWWCVEGGVGVDDAVGARERRVAGKSARVVWCECVDEIDGGVGVCELLWGVVLEWWVVVVCCWFGVVCGGRARRRF